MVCAYARSLHLKNVGGGEEDALRADGMPEDARGSLFKGARIPRDEKAQGAFPLFCFLRPYPCRKGGGTARRRVKQSCARQKAGELGGKQRKVGAAEHDGVGTQKGEGKDGACERLL